MQLVVEDGVDFVFWGGSGEDFDFGRDSDVLVRYQTSLDCKHHILLRTFYILLQIFNKEGLLTIHLILYRQLDYFH